MTLLPGDVIYTGTPQGVILGYPPEKRVWLDALAPFEDARVKKQGETP